MRTVFSDIHQVAHLWAHQAQEEARNSQDNFYFHNNTIYSYGAHFICGQIVFNKRGEKAYVLNDNSYSSTTSKHQGVVKSSIPFGSTIFSTSGADTPNTIGNKYQYGYSQAIKAVCNKIVKIETLMQKEVKAISRDYKPQILSLIKEIDRWIKFWELNKKQKWGVNSYLPPVWQPDIDTYLNASKRAIDVCFNCIKTPEKAASYLCLFNLIRALDEINYENIENIISQFYGSDVVKQEPERLEKINKAKAKQALANKKKLLQEDAKNLKKWKANDKQTWNPSSEFWVKFGWDTSLRIKNDLIETSKHIKISLEEGKRLWTLVQAFHNGHEFRHDLALDLNGHQWKINSYKNDILTAGCHTIHFSECQEIANQLGW